MAMQAIQFLSNGRAGMEALEHVADTITDKWDPQYQTMSEMGLPQWRGRFSVIQVLCMALRYLLSWGGAPRSDPTLGVGLLPGVGGPLQLGLLLLGADVPGTLLAQYV